MTKFQKRFEKLIESIKPIKDLEPTAEDFMAFKAHEVYGAKPTNYKEPKENE